MTDWQQELKDGLSDSDELCDYLEIPFSRQILNNSIFPLRVPREFASRMEKGNPNDPLLRQVLPHQDELVSPPHFTFDPVGDLTAMAEPGVIHKYQGRVLLITTAACAIHCRYCFRRNFPYSESQLSQQKIATAMAYIEARPSISEVILSGGDPLLLSDARLSALLHALEQIPHLKTIRFHTRVPIVLPSRITDSVCQRLAQSCKKIVWVLHANHPNELNHRVKAVCEKLLNHRVLLLNQAVLLKGVNDQVATLCDLSERLFSFNVMPYYLHLLDKAVGTHHFDIDQTQAIALIRQIKNKLPGYLVPKLVREQAGAGHKTVID